MPTGSPDTLLSFFVVLKRHDDDELVIQRLRAAADIQQELSRKFLDMAVDWQGDTVEKCPYSPTHHPHGNEVTALPSFDVPKLYRDAAIAGQDTPPFTLPVP